MFFAYDTIDLSTNSCEVNSQLEQKGITVYRLIYYFNWNILKLLILKNNYEYLF